MVYHVFFKFERLKLLEMILVRPYGHFGKSPSENIEFWKTQNFDFQILDIWPVESWFLDPGNIGKRPEIKYIFLEI